MTFEEQMSQWNRFHRICLKCKQHSKSGFVDICQLRYFELSQDKKCTWERMGELSNPLSEKFQLPEKCPYALEHMVHA